MINSLYTESDTVQSSGCDEIITLTISGGNDEGVPPVPIPNTEVKPFSADGTWLVTARESRSPPDSIFLSSSMAEHSAVNRRVVGSSPTWGALRPDRKIWSFCAPQQIVTRLRFGRTSSARRPAALSAFSIVVQAPWSGACTRFE